MLLLVIATCIVLDMLLLVSLLCVSIGPDWAAQTLSFFVVSAKITSEVLRISNAKAAPFVASAFFFRLTCSLLSATASMTRFNSFDSSKTSSHLEIVSTMDEIFSCDFRVCIPFSSGSFSPPTFSDSKLKSSTSLSTSRWWIWCASSQDGSDFQFLDNSASDLSTL